MRFESLQVMVDVMASPSEDFEDGELLEDGEICDDEVEETPTPKQGRILILFAEKFRHSRVEKFEQ